MGHGADGGPDLHQQSLQIMLETMTVNTDFGMPVDETAGTGRREWRSRETAGKSIHIDIDRGSGSQEGTSTQNSI